MTEATEEFMREYFDVRRESKKTRYKVVVFIALIALAFLAVWIIQTAFGYFGFDLTLWQTFIVWVAVLSLQRGDY